MKLWWALVVRRDHLKDAEPVLQGKNAG